MHLSLLLSLLPLALAAPQHAKRSEPAPLLVSRDVDALIADTYIVKFKDGSALSALDDAVGTLSLDAAEHVYNGTFNGFSGKLDKKTLDLLRDHPDVEYIEQDAVVKAYYVEQANAPWGLARISSRTPGATSYFHYPTGGAGTCAYIIDTGIDATHPDFGGRATFAQNFVGGANTDGNGHGTHVAGIIGSNTYGVAKATHLYGFKALSDNGSGTVSGIILAMNTVPTHAATVSCPNGVFINMSLGGSFSAAMNSAAAGLVASGIFLGAAAGNSNSNAAGFSPASEPTVCTVGSSDQSDTVATTSNYGPLIDVYAPGRLIPSTWLGGGVNTISGTSMATPHVVGLAAYLASVEGTANPGGLCSRIQELATRDALAGVPAGTPNLLAFNGYPNL